MKRIMIIVGAVAVVALGAWLLTGRRPAATTGGEFTNGAGNMRIESAAFEQGGEIPSKYTCDGPDISPPLTIIGAPADTKSLALLVDDPDSVGGNWVHWLVWNIDPTFTQIAEGTAPRKGIEGITSFGRSGWGGPCPPSGTHRYFFKVYALDISLDLKPSADGAEFEKAIVGHILDKAGLLGNYQRK